MRGFYEADSWPTVNASGSYSRQRMSANQPLIGSLPGTANIPLENDVYQAGFDAAWEIDVFGGKRRRWKGPPPTWPRASRPATMCR